MSVHLSIVVPVYNEEGNIPQFLKTILAILQSISPSFEIIFVMDPSTDKTEELIESAAKNDPRIKLVKLSRRFGQPKATLAGLHLSIGDAVIVMDVDMQDPPELIQEMVKKWKAGYDVVYAKRNSRRGETVIKKVVSYVGYKVVNKIAEVNIPPNTGDFRLMSRRVVEELKKLKESHGFLRGMVALVGFKQTEVLFDRPERFSGQGNYNRFLGSLKIGLNGIICFSNYTLTLSTVFGFIVATFAFIVAVVYFFMKLAGAPFPLGNPTIVIIVLFLGGVQLITIGILGEYIGRIYEEVRNRPLYIVDRTIGIKTSASTEPTRSMER